MYELKKKLQSATNIIYTAVKLKTLFLLHTTNTNIECPCSSVNVLAVKLQMLFVHTNKATYCSVDKKSQLDVTFCILYFSSNSCSTCFGQPCAHHQELTTA